MNKKEDICEKCMYSMPFTCVDENNEMISLNKDKNYDNKLFNVLKIRGACSHRMDECFLTDGCRWFKSKQHS